MNDFAQPDRRAAKRAEVAPHVALPDPDKRRFPVGVVLIIAWIAVFLTIFIVLAQLKINAPKQQSPTTPGETTTSAPTSPATPQGAGSDASR